MSVVSPLNEAGVFLKQVVEVLKPQRLVDFCAHQTNFLVVGLNNWKGEYVGIQMLNRPFTIKQENNDVNQARISRQSML